MLAPGSHLGINFKVTLTFRGQSQRTGPFDNLTESLDQPAPLGCQRKESKVTGVMMQNDWVGDVVRVERGSTGQVADLVRLEVQVQKWYVFFSRSILHFLSC